MIAVGGGAFLIPDKLPDGVESQSMCSMATAPMRWAPPLRKSRASATRSSDLSRSGQARALPTTVWWPRVRARGSLATIESEDMPLAYLPGIPCG